MDGRLTFSAGMLRPLPTWQYILEICKYYYSSKEIDGHLREEMLSSLPKSLSDKTPFMGIGLYWAWLLLAFYSDALVPSSSAAPEETVEFVWLWAACFHFLALIAIAVLSSKLRTFANSKAMSCSGCFGTSIASLLLALVSYLRESLAAFYYPLSIACVLLLGISSAILLVQWCTIYIEKLRRTRSTLFALSYGLSLVVYLLAMAFPSALRSVITVALPALCFVAQKRCIEGKQEPLLVPEAKHSNASWPSAGLMLSVFAMFITALCGEILRSFSVQLANETVNFMGTLYVVGSFVGAIVFLFSFKSFAVPSVRITMPLVRNCFLTMAAAFLIVPFISEWSVAIAYALFGAGFWAFRAVTWVMCFNYVHRANADGVRIVAIMDAVFTLAPIVSGKLVPLMSYYLTDAMSMSFAASVMVYLLLVTVIFLFVGKRASLFEDPELIAEFDEALLAGSDGLNESKSSEDVQRLASEESDPMAALCKRYKLSSRESEVFILLARGRSLPYIQNELVISEGTAQTHARHIYKKLGVHSRQELHDLVDRELGAMG